MAAKDVPGLKHCLSAILMDANYFALVKTNIINKQGLPLLNTDGLIALKARAFLDLEEQRIKGDAVNYEKFL